MIKVTLLREYWVYSYGEDLMTSCWARSFRFKSLLCLTILGVWLYIRYNQHIFQDVHCPIRALTLTGFSFWSSLLKFSQIVFCWTTERFVRLLTIVSMEMGWIVMNDCLRELRLMQLISAWLIDVESQQVQVQISWAIQTMLECWGLTNL